MNLKYRGVSYQPSSPAVVAPVPQAEQLRFLGQPYNTQHTEPSDVYTGWLQFLGIRYAC